MSGEISGFIVFTNQISAGVSAAGMVTDTSDVGESILDIGQGTHSIISVNPSHLDIKRQIGYG